MNKTCRIIKILTSLVVLMVGTWVQAEEDFLRVEEAFKYTAEIKDDAVIINWTIAPDYYLYKSRMSYVSKTEGVEIATPVMSKGKMKNDEFFGLQEIYYDKADAVIPFTANSGIDQLTLQIRTQGCLEKVLCYPPQRWDVTLDLPSVQTASSRDEGLLDSLIRNNNENFGADGLLPAEEAFQADALMLDDYTLMVRWNIEDGYYLYKDKLKVTGVSDLIQLGRTKWPDGVEKSDESFGEVEVFYNFAETSIPISRASKKSGRVDLTLNYQGCAEGKICYPPGVRTISLAIDEATTEAALSAVSTGGNTSTESVKISEQDKLANLISTGSLPATLAVFFGLGLLLAFTPCVLPMVPILSGIIAGQGENLTNRRSFVLSLVYVLAMALTYTVIGVIVGLLGKNIQAIFQDPFVLIAFSTVFVVLALAMFDVWQFQVPVAIQNKLNQAGAGGTYFGVGIMGVLSALIVGPCVAAPLVGALIFIGQSGDGVRGGLVLFALSMGMGAPLLAYGATAGQIMLRAGAWMETIKHLFGILLLGVAVWLLARILPAQIIMFLWAALALGTAWVLGVFRKDSAPLFRVAGAAALLYGVALTASGIAGGYDPVNLKRGTPWGAEEHHLEFQIIKSVDELQAAVAGAAKQNRTAMLDFYADWCVECKEMEKYTFNTSQVMDALGSTLLLQADVTANDEIDQKLLEHFGIYGPPTIVFFGPDGKELRNFRVVGFMSADEFAQHTIDALGSQ